ncbi:hypothetical protein PCE1_000824 [Barthelona sp. PCE]
MFKKEDGVSKTEPRVNYFNPAHKSLNYDSGTACSVTTELDTDNGGFLYFKVCYGIMDGSYRYMNIIREFKALRSKICNKISDVHFWHLSVALEQMVFSCQLDTKAKVLVVIKGDDLRMLQYDDGNTFYPQLNQFSREFSNLSHFCQRYSCIDNSLYIHRRFMHLRSAAFNILMFESNYGTATIDGPIFSSHNSFALFAFGQRCCLYASPPPPTKISCNNSVSEAYIEGEKRNFLMITIRDMKERRGADSVLIFDISNIERNIEPVYRLKIGNTSTIHYLTESGFFYSCVSESTNLCFYDFETEESSVIYTTNARSPFSFITKDSVIHFSCQNQTVVLTQNGDEWLSMVFDGCSCVNQYRMDTDMRVEFGNFFFGGRKLHIPGDFHVFLSPSLALLNTGIVRVTENGIEGIVNFSCYCENFVFKDSVLTIYRIECEHHEFTRIRYTIENDCVVSTVEEIFGPSFFANCCFIHGSQLYNTESEDEGLIII